MNRRSFLKLCCASVVLPSLLFKKEREYKYIHKEYAGKTEVRGNDSINDVDRKLMDAMARTKRKVFRDGDKVYYRVKPTISSQHDFVNNKHYRAIYTRFTIMREV